MKDLQAVILAAVFSLPAALRAGRRRLVPPLTDEHWNALAYLSFKTPAGLDRDVEARRLETTEARGEGLMMRIFRRPGGLGLDAMHVECMLMRLAGPMDTQSGGRLRVRLHRRRGRGAPRARLGVRGRVRRPRGGGAQVAAA